MRIHAATIFEAIPARLLWAWFLFNLPGAPALADEVIFRGESPDGPYVVVDRGSLSGIAVGTDVCFIGADAKELFCAPVVKTRGKVAAVRLTEDQYEVVAVKMAVRLREGASGGPAASENPSLAIEATEESTGMLGLDYIYGYRLPVAFATPLFSARSRAAQTGNPWSKGDLVQSSPIGIGLSWNMILEDDVRVLLRGAWQQIPAVSTAVDYNPVDPANYAETTTSGYAMRLLGEYQSGVWATGPVTLFAGVGLDLGRVQATISAKSYGGTDEGQIASLTSRLNVIAASLSGIFSWAYGEAWELQGGARLAIPLTTFGASASGSYDLPDDMAVMGSTDEDLKSIVNHRKNSYGLEFLMGAALAI